VTGANVVLCAGGANSGSPKCLSGATSRRKKDRGKGGEEKDGRDGRKHLPPNKFLITALANVFGISSL